MEEQDNKKVRLIEDPLFRTIYKELIKLAILKEIELPESVNFEILEEIEQDLKVSK